MLSAPPAGEIPALAAAVARDASDVDAVILLAAAYRGEGRLDDAAELLAPLLADHPERAELLAMAGVIAEDRERWVEARDYFDAFLTHVSSGPLAEEVRAHRDAVRLSALRQEVRDALAREAELADTPPDPAAVGIFPFAYTGTDPAWEPLRLALADLLITDLSVTGRLRVVERVKIQEFTRELDLSEAGLVDPSTAARSGRILGSGHVVQGSFDVADGETIEVDAAVVAAPSPDAPGAGGELEVHPVRLSNRVERLFDLEQQMALSIHDALGVQLTPGERERVTERETESIQALLAFGRGLEALDRGSFQEAEAAFAEAQRLDPSFALAAQRRETAASARRASQDRTHIQGTAMRRAQRRRAVHALRGASASTRRRLLQRLSKRRRAVLAEVLGQDRVGQTILLELVFKVPGGGP
ncbi:MAG: CsgG/HfaB family protein [Gemmatimonadota bacterium]